MIIIWNSNFSKIQFSKVEKIKPFLLLLSMIYEKQNKLSTAQKYALLARNTQKNIEDRIAIYDCLANSTINPMIFKKQLPIKTPLLLLLIHYPPLKHCAL